MSLAKALLSKKGVAFGGALSGKYNPATSAKKVTVSKGPGGSKFSIAITGIDEIDNELRKIAAESGAKSVNTEMRKVTREAMKTIVHPKVISRIPEDTGFLKSQVKVRAIPRSRSKLGYRVGFRDPLFTGDTFYGGFLEYGFIHRSGTLVYGDSFLRGPLYESEHQIRAYVIGRMKRWVKAR